MVGISGPRRSTGKAVGEGIGEKKIPKRGGFQSVVEVESSEPKCHGVTGRGRIGEEKEQKGIKER